MRRHVIVSIGPRILGTPIAVGSAALLSLLTGHASAQDIAPPTVARASNAAVSSAPLTLQSAMAMAMAANAELSASRRELEATEGALMQSGARPNPELSLLVEDTKRETRTSTLQIAQPIELGGKRAARIGAAERGRDIAAAELDAKYGDLRATVVTAFHEVLLAQEHARLAGEATALAQRAADAAGKRVLAGKISPVEETRARVAEANARLASSLAASELRQSRRRLAATWGDAVPRFGDVESAGELATVPSPASLQARLAASPSLRRARIEVQRRSALTELERARRTPDITLTLGVKRDEQLGRNQAVVGIAVPLPLFDRNQGNLVEALRREDKARDELAAAQIGLQTAVLQAWGRLENATAEAATIREQVLPGAQSAYDAATQGFALGKFDLSDVLDAQRTLFLARSQSLQARGEAYRAAAELDRLLGDVHTTTGEDAAAH